MVSSRRASRMNPPKELSVDKLEQAIQTLIPWWSFSNENILKTLTEKSTITYLNRYYLFPLTEITANNDCEDIPKFINERYQTILSAANTSGISVAIIINSKNGKTSVYLGFMKEESSENNPELFQSIINGILPGKKIKFKETVKITSLIDGFSYGGIITGVPILKKDDEKHRFNISSVVRSLYGKDYTLAIISKPVSEENKQQLFRKLIQIRDELHSLAKRTVGEERGTGSSISISGTKSIQPNIIYSLLNRLLGTKEYISSPGSEGTTESISKQQSQSLSIEQQNGSALVLEKIAEQHIERMTQGFNAGFWETAITFAANDKITCDILGGSFIGELSKPNDKLLPPPRLYLDEIQDGQTLFLPKTSSSNIIFPKSLASYITSEELSLISSPPTESIPGYEIKKMPQLALTDLSEEGEIKLGNIADHGNSMENSFLYLSNIDLNKHLFVCGLTGSGKTTTVKNILKSITKNEDLPFLVLESAKRDYRQLLADDVFKGKLNLFTIGDATVSPIRFNPFYIQEGIHPLVHIDYLKAIFNASFSLYGPMPSIVEKCLHRIYLKRGWNLTTGIHPNFVDEKGKYDESRYNLLEHHYCFPTLTDLKDEVDNYVKNELEYKGELSDNIRTAIVVRLESLCVGAKGLMFNTYDFYSLKDLLTNSTIFEMENLADDDDKAFFVGLILVLINEYRQRDNPSINPGSKGKGLQHFLVIEEAHRLLKNVETERISEMMGNPKGKAVEAFCNVISEMRSLGQGVAVVEQIPTKISPDVIKNSNTKIVHRLVAKDDQSLLAGSLSISDDDALYLSRLNTGHALCHKEGMERPVECDILDDVKSYAISDQKIYREMAKLKIKTLHSFEAYELAVLLKNNGKELAVKFLNSLCTIKSNNLNELVSSAEKELQKLLLLGNIHTCFNETIFADYITKQIFELLTKGVYCKTLKFPENLKQILLEVVENSDKIQYEILMKCFIELWCVSQAKDFIIEVVENLSFKYLIQNKSDFSFKNVASVVSTLFLTPDKKLVEMITQDVINEKGVVNG
jgi:hypothetical protein